MKPAKEFHRHFVLFIDLDGLHDFQKELFIKSFEWFLQLKMSILSFFTSSSMVAGFRLEFFLSGILKLCQLRVDVVGLSLIYLDGEVPL